MKYKKIRDVFFPYNIELYNEDNFPEGSLLVGLKGKEYEKFYDDQKQRSAGKVIKITLGDNNDKVDQFRDYLKSYYTRALSDENHPLVEQSLVEKLDNDSYLRTEAIDIHPEYDEYKYAMDYPPPSGGGKTRKRKRKSHKRKSHKRKSNKRKSNKRKSNKRKSHKRKSRKTRR